MRSSTRSVTCSITSPRLKLMRSHISMKITYYIRPGNVLSGLCMSITDHCMQSQDHQQFDYPGLHGNDIHFTPSIKLYVNSVQMSLARHWALKSQYLYIAPIQRIQLDVFRWSCQFSLSWHVPWAVTCCSILLAAWRACCKSSLLRALTELDTFILSKAWKWDPSLELLAPVIELLAL